ncbi:hypothetical protein CWE15_06025 [Aliidiomarina taiwanensis]|uniref:phosphoenolpyruvate--protein phosphotransferase n=1 Tax=Aliidiomarina taiwanensis TaxID=946228 RepID=A0A432X883_9GAMM|nr:hypothetical protein CWE15_06025 [Aliidiomarina taiwanensis]
MMLGTLQRIVESVHQAPEFDAALDTMVRKVKSALETDVCSIYLTDHEVRQFVLMATDGLDVEPNRRVALNFGEGLISLAAEREEPLNIADVRKSPHFKPVDGIGEEPFLSMLVAPIIYQRQVLGVLAVQQVSARQFTSDEESFVVTLATKLAAVISHAEVKDLVSDQRSPWLRSLKAIAGAPGIALGPVYIGKPVAQLSAVVPRRTEQPWYEIHKFRKAVAKTRQDLRALADQVAEYVAADTLAIFDVYQGMLDAASLGNAVEEKIKEGWQAKTAVKLVVEDFVSQFEDIEDSYLRERAVDVRDLGQRVLANLLDKSSQHEAIPDQAILVAEEVTASMLASIPREHLAGLVSLRGSPNSHAAIMARSMGVPAVFSLDDVSLSYFEEQYLVVDGYSGDVYINPPIQVVNEYKALYQEELELDQVVQSKNHLPAETKDGQVVELQLNAGLVIDHTEDRGAHHGIGLYRTEIPFMLRDRFPTETEQVKLYSDIFARYAGQPVVMRTLDVGGDKPLPYFPIQEENPFLGWRGIRITLDHPDIFLVQVRAMLRANVGLNTLRILLPMVTSIDEVDDAIRLMNQAYFEVRNELQEEGERFELKRPQIGIMIEVPAVLYQLEQIAQRVDFFSVGTNDLTQYLLAVDRNNPRVTRLYEAYHPSLLLALDSIIQVCQRLEKPVGVCGELAGDPGGAMLLVALGYRSLSVGGHNLDRIRWAVRQMDSQRLGQLRADVLQASRADDVRRHVRMELERLGLGGFIRAGK